MASDISRKTFDSKKRYSGVLMQQGRVQLDADWNEQLDIQQYRLHTQTHDVIGKSGVPKGINNGNAFKISMSADLSDIRIDFGRMYVGGLLCELDAPEASYLKQPFSPDPDTQYFAKAGSPPKPGKLLPGTYIVYADAWQREINYLDDPHIQEIALGGPDTTTRLQTVWQVKLFKTSNVDGKCDSVFQDWEDEIAEKTGSLAVQTKPTEETDDPCVLPPQGGYRRVENQLYRIEVQKGGTLAQTTFKWSRDNASVETTIDIDSTSPPTSPPDNVIKFKVADVAKDEILGFAAGQWVEVVDEASTLNNTPHPLLQIKEVNHANKTITVHQSSIPLQATGTLKLRRWDHSNQINIDGIQASTAWLDLEDGIQVKFTDGTYRAGDYWLVPARTIKGTIEWPLEPDGITPQTIRPMGVKHAYCKLAVLKVTANNYKEPDDCRPKFPSLTTICAEDICYDNRNCVGSTAQTVQQALDDLCKRNDCACTYTVHPGAGWESVFAKIPNGQDAHICFQAGTYPLTETAVITLKGHLKLSGAGKGSRIVAATQEAALVFDNCSSVLARDLYVETGRTGFSPKSKTNHLNGALNFIKCREVQVDTVDMKCGLGKTRAATCLTIREADVARVMNCDLSIGHFQQGMLLVDVKEAFVENNTLKTYARPEKWTLSEMLRDPLILANMRKSILADVSLAAKDEKPGSRNVKATVGEMTVLLRTNSRLKGTMSQLLKEAPAETLKTETDVRKYLHKSVDKLLRDEKYRKKYDGFFRYYEELNQLKTSIAAQGITVGGKVAGVVKILNNTLENTLQGIHVGLSQHGPRNLHLHSGTVVISGNVIDVTLPVETHTLGRHGIFAGNCKDLLIENNRITLLRLAEADYIEIDGIRVWGILGDRMMINQNHIGSKVDNQDKSFDVGIRVHPIIPIVRQRQQWVVMWNVAPSKQQTLNLFNGAQNIQGTNMP